MSGHFITAPINRGDLGHTVYAESPGALDCATSAVKASSDIVGLTRT